MVGFDAQCENVRKAVKAFARSEAVKKWCSIFYKSHTSLTRRNTGSHTRVVISSPYTRHYMSFIRRMRAYGARPLLLGAALLGIVIVAGLAALESHRSFVARKAAAERTVRDYAKFAAYLYATRTYLFARERNIVPSRGFRSDLTYKRDELPPLSVMPAIPDSTERCGTGWVPYRFRLDLPARTVQYLGGQPLPAIDSIIRDSLPTLASSPWVKLAGLGFLFVDPPGKPRETVAYMPTMDSARNVLAVYGYRSCYGVRDTSDYSLMYRVVKVLPPMTPGYQQDTTSSYAPGGSTKSGKASAARSAGSDKKPVPPNLAAAERMHGRWPNGMPADSLLTLTIYDDHKRVLFQAPKDGQSSDLNGGSPVLYIGGVWIQVSLRPNVAKYLVAGGIPESHVPVSLVLFAGAIVLAIAGFASLRSEMRLVRSRERFLANVSHELRTPLQQILLFVQLIRLGRTRSEAEKEKSLEIIERETNRLIALSNSVLAASSKPEMQLESSDVDVAGVAQTAADFFTPLAEARKMRIELDVEQPAIARGDPGAIRQILINVLDNAAKYGPTGQIIKIGVRKEGPLVRLWVDDRGPGIPTAERNNVWKPFVRLGGTVDDSTGGAGLGLSIVRELAAAMDASAELSDVPGGGTRFSLALQANHNGAH
ncbi:MAG TPA: HAMP domain-containing sensor histidine kinase [Gemmatimonadaceae bacterium]|nr:HAMP domain-containing sensor histidine kinase [Gemmatimonadaceae bacterium]